MKQELIKKLLDALKEYELLGIADQIDYKSSIYIHLLPIPQPLRAAQLQRLRTSCFSMKESLQKAVACKSK